MLILDSPWDDPDPAVLNSKKYLVPTSQTQSVSGQNMFCLYLLLGDDAAGCERLLFFELVTKVRLEFFLKQANGTYMCRYGVNLRISLPRTAINFPFEFDRNRNPAEKREPSLPFPRHSGARLCPQRFMA